jgi:hypothetical protein
MKTVSEFDQSYKSEVAALRERIDRGDTRATDELIERALEQGDIGELRRLADAGNPTAIDQLIELATELGDLAELRRLSDSGSDTTTDQLIELATEQVDCRVTSPRRGRARQPFGIEPAQMCPTHQDRRRGGSASRFGSSRTRDTRASPSPGNLSARSVGSSQRWSQSPVEGDAGLRSSHCTKVRRGGRTTTRP